LNKSFVEGVSRSIQQTRPTYRAHALLDESEPHGLLVQDYTFLIQPTLCQTLPQAETINQESICVEIKVVELCLYFDLSNLMAPSSAKMGISVDSTR
jgi:hypothetical protein